MEQPYFFIALIASFIAGIALKTVLDMCYKRGEPPECDEADIFREARMMKDAQVQQRERPRKKGSK